jgi:hypothetical protein
MISIHHELPDIMRDAERYRKIREMASNEENITSEEFDQRVDDLVPNEN